MITNNLCWLKGFVWSDARETQPELLPECKCIIASLPLMISSLSIVTYTQSVSLPSPHHHNLIHVTTMTQYRITSHHGRSPPVLPQHTATAMSAWWSRQCDEVQEPLSTRSADIHLTFNIGEQLFGEAVTFLMKIKPVRFLSFDTRLM